MTRTDPRDAVAALAASRTPYLLGVRHHSPALAAVVGELLDASGADVVCVELPAEFQPWLEHLADPETVAPVALAGTGEDGRLAFYPFADFSPELAAIRWARARGAAVLCCDLPLSSRAWAGTPADAGPDRPGQPAPAVDGAPESAPAPGADPLAPGRSYADGLTAAGTGRTGEDMWDRAVEVLAPGCSPEAVRRAALGVGWALREDAAVPATDLAREAHMREVIATAAAGGRTVAAVIGAFHAPALLGPPTHAPAPWETTPAGAADAAGSGATAAPTSSAAATGSARRAPTGAGAPGSASAAGTTVASGAATPAAPTGSARFAPAGAAPAGAALSGPAPSGGGSAWGAGIAAGSGGVSARGTGAASAVGIRAGRGVAGAVAESGGGAVTSFVPYSFDLLDSRSGYPAGIRDPLWQQAVLHAAGDPVRVREAASVAVTRLCRELRRAGHTAGTGEAAEALRLACDLAVLRGLPAPGRGELIEAVTTVLGQGEPLGRGRALARALEAVFVGTSRGRITPHAPRSGLGPSVEAEVAELRLPGPDDPAPRELRLDPLRSPLDGRREVLLQRLAVCGASYGEPVAVAATGDGSALGTKWRLAWTPSVPARLDLAGVRGVTAAQAAAGTLRDTARRAAADGGPTPAGILAGLAAAARCDLPELVGVRLHEAASVLPRTATLPELLDALDLLEALHRGHLPGAGEETRATAAALTGDLLEAAVRSLPGLAGSDDPADAAALVALADRAAAFHLGLRTDAALAGLARDASPLMQGAALAVRVLLDLDPAADLGDRAAGWIDGAAGPDRRRALTRRLGARTSS
ncbi:DUF5682 family protein [Streptomyces sp. NPDC002044]|uniref:DUF5682 family protein n=1 Tax=Streptomyces sp. NPDC002044 TaxID=3154662 RepID=UPI00331FF5C4